MDIQLQSQAWDQLINAWRTMLSGDQQVRVGLLALQRHPERSHFRQTPSTFSEGGSLHVDRNATTSCLWVLKSWCLSQKKVSDPKVMDGYGLPCGCWVPNLGPLSLMVTLLCWWWSSLGVLGVCRQGAAGLFWNSGGNNSNIPANISEVQSITVMVGSMVTCRQMWYWRSS